MSMVRVQFKSAYDYLKDLLSYKPYALLGGEIKDYRLQIVSLILKQMRELATELYEKLTAAYPAFKAYAPNFIGKYVYVRTMKPSRNCTTRGTVTSSGGMTPLCSRLVIQRTGICKSSD